MSEIKVNLETYLWLDWFYDHCDFGPAHEDCVRILMDAYEQKTDNKVPDEYKWWLEDEDE